LAQEEGRKSPGRTRIFKPPRFHHYHSAPDNCRRLRNQN
jgi:hypothetical protein